MAVDSKNPNEIEDPGGQNQREQIQQLNNVRKNIIDVRNGALDRLLNNRISERKANTAYRQAIVAYVMQLAPYLQSEKYGTDEGDLWDEEVIGEFSIKAPDIDTSTHTQYRGVEPEVYTGEIEGVKDLLEIPSPIPVEFTVFLDDEVRGMGSEKRIKRGEIDRATLDSIVIRLDQFRVDVGLGLNLPDEITDESENAF